MSESQKHHMPMEAIIRKNALNPLGDYAKLKQLVDAGIPMTFLMVPSQKSSGGQTTGEFIAEAVRKGCFNWFDVVPVIGTGYIPILYIIYTTTDRSAALRNFTGYLADSLGVADFLMAESGFGVSRITLSSDAMMRQQTLASELVLDKLPEYLGEVGRATIMHQSVKAGAFPRLYVPEPSGQRISRLVFFRALEVTTERGLNFAVERSGKDAPPEYKAISEQCFKDVYNSNVEMARSIEVAWKTAALGVGTLSRYYPENTDLEQMAVDEQIRFQLNVEKIYFDMDGVLADFVAGAVKVLGKTDYTDDEMWAAISKVPGFYDRLDVMAGAKELFEALYDRYGDRCEILTALPKEKRGIPTSEADKISWVRRELSDTIVINAVKSREEKQAFCKGLGTILIDDWKSNIIDWQASGGIGIRFTDSAAVITRLKAIGVL